jgi:16S rRNA (uracil1498-N3)-methyltransferase
VCAALVIRGSGSEVNDHFRPLIANTQLAAAQLFQFDSAFADGLRARDVRPKEAFTVQSASPDGWYRASLVTLTADGGSALVYEQLAASPEPVLDVVLVCAILGRQRMLPVAQKSAELGCSGVIPLLSAHAVPVLELAKEKPWAWQGQAIKGSRQCRRGRVPWVGSPMTLAATLAHQALQAAELVYVMDDVAWPASAHAPKTACQRREGGTLGVTRVVLAVGPEGGWSAAERLQWQTYGAIRLQLGPRVLRAETAVFAGLTVIQHQHGDFQQALLNTIS